MTRKLTFIFLTAASALCGASACSSTDKELPPVKAISACDTNKVATGGYLWTYTDAGKDTYGTVNPYTIFVEGGDPGANVAYTVTASPDTDDPGNSSCGITGVKPEDPKSSDPQFTMLDTCGDNPLYPVAGVGFSFLDKNATFSICDKLGLRFRARGAITNAGVAAAALSIRVALPTVETDIWAAGDKWADSPLGQTCTCDNNKPADTDKTCFGFFGKLFDVTTEWQWFTMLWGEMGQPTWAGVVAFEPTHVLKAQFGIEGQGDYTLEIDDIQFVLPADGVDWCAQGLSYQDITTADAAAFCAMAAKDEPICTGTLVGEHF